MKVLGRVLFYSLLLVVLAFWTLFTIHNPDYLSLRFLAWNSMQLPISVWLLVAFLFGALFGLLLCASGYFKGRATQKNLKSELDRRDAEEHPAEHSVSSVESYERRPMSVSNAEGSEGSTTQ